jgi:hypothetical protein
MHLQIIKSRLSLCAADLSHETVEQILLDWTILLETPKAKVYDAIFYYLQQLDKDLDGQSVNENPNKTKSKVLFVILQILYGVFYKTSYVTQIFAMKSMHHLNPSLVQEVRLSYFYEISKIIKKKLKSMNYKINTFELDLQGNLSKEDIKYLSGEDSSADMSCLLIEDTICLSALYNIIVFPISAYGGVNGNDNLYYGFYLYILKLIQRFNSIEDLFQLRLMIIEFYNSSNTDNLLRLNVDIDMWKIVFFRDYIIGLMFIMLNAKISNSIIQEGINSNIDQQTTYETTQKTEQIFEQLKTSFNATSYLRCGYLNLNPDNVRDNAADFSCIELNETIKSFRERYPKEENSKIKAYQINQLIYQKCLHCLKNTVTPTKASNNKIVFYVDIPHEDRHIQVKRICDLQIIHTLYLHHLEEYIDAIKRNRYDNQESKQDDHLEENLPDDEILKQIDHLEENHPNDEILKQIDHLEENHPNDEILKQICQLNNQPEKLILKRQISNFDKINTMKFIGINAIKSIKTIHFVDIVLLAISIILYTIICLIFIINYSNIRYNNG